MTENAQMPLRRCRTRQLFSNNCPQVLATTTYAKEN